MKLLEVGLGKEYSIIQDAIDAIPITLDDWYKIVIYNGSYDGFIVNDKITTYLTKYILITANNGDSVIINSDIILESKYIYVENLKIDGVTVYFQSGSDNSIIRKCEFNSINYGVIFNGSYNGEVNSCLFCNGVNGIQINDGISNNIRNNIIRDLSGIGISNNIDEQVFIINNTIDNNNIGIEFLSNQDIRIRNNNITNNDVGIKRVDNLVDFSIKSNNNVWNNTINYLNTSFGENAFSFDPKYVDYINKNFALMYDSLCIDKGTYINAPNTDYNNVSRPLLKGFDIGAFEYKTANTEPYIIINSIIERNNGTGMVDISYQGIDENNDICNLKLYKFSLTGDFSGEEKDMSISRFDSLHDRIDYLDFSFEGSTFNFVWNAYEDLGDNFEGNVYIRIMANDGEFDSNEVNGTIYIDTKKPIINIFEIDYNSEIEENITIDGIVNLNINCSIDTISMKFSNNSIDWSTYEPYNTSKVWNLINGNGGHPYQGLKYVYIKVKDCYGNESDGSLFKIIWYKISDVTVKNLRNNSYTHSISKAIKDAVAGDTIEVQSNETFFESFIIDKSIAIKAGDNYKPTIDITDKNAILIENSSDVTVEGFNFIESNNRLINIINSNNVNILRNIFDHEYCLSVLNSNNILIDRNIFKDTYKGIEIANSYLISCFNNQFIRNKIIAIELLNSPSKIINNTFIDSVNCIENLFPNDNSSIIRNNIFYGCSGIVINANPLWIIDHNNFYNNKKEYFGLVERWEEYQNFKDNPKFVKYEEDNFYLIQDSPCINKGSFKEAPDHDFNNNYRKQDVNFDIGAFEYSSKPEYVFNIDNILNSNDVKNVFIYDTKKDDISNNWCNSEKSWKIEKGVFPEVVFLITTSEGLYIVDYNNLNNKLWMKFEQGLSNVVNNDSPIVSLFALNGVIYISNGENGGLIVIDFINDVITKFLNSGKYIYNSNIEDRNNGNNYTNINNKGISGNNIKDISVVNINGNNYLAVATENKISVIKNLDNIIFYGDGNLISRVILTKNARLYYIDSNNVSVFYDIDEDIENKKEPNYIYSTTNEYGPKLFSETINDISILEGDSKVIRDANVESNTIYVATDNGINVLYTYEDTKASERFEESEKWGYSVQYLLKNDYNPLIETPNLLESNNANPDFENGTVVPENWTSNGYPVYSKTSNDSYSGSSAIRVCFNNSFSSNILIPIKGNSNYIFGAAIKADQIDSKSVIRIDWYNSEEELISSSLLDIGADIYYRKYYANIKSPIISSEEQFNHGFAKIILDGDGLDSNKRFWFDDIGFYEDYTKTYINNYVLDGNIKNIGYIFALKDILLLIAKEDGNDRLYVYSRSDLKLKMIRDVNLPSRNISSFYCNKII